MEKRHNYVRKVAQHISTPRWVALNHLLCFIGVSAQVAEVAVQLFISNDKPNCSGLILAGSADFKTELSQSDMFDSRLQVELFLVLYSLSHYEEP